MDGCWCRQAGRIRHKLLISWDLNTQPSLWFTEDGPKKRKYPVSSSWVVKKLCSCERLEENEQLGGVSKITGNPHHMGSQTAHQHLPPGEESPTEVLLLEEIKPSPTQFLVNFYRSTIKSILCHCATMWYTSCTTENRRDLAQVVKQPKGS